MNIFNKKKSEPIKPVPPVKPEPVPAPVEPENTGLPRKAALLIPKNIIFNYHEEWENNSLWIDLESDKLPKKYGVKPGQASIRVNILDLLK